VPIELRLQETLLDSSRLGSLNALVAGRRRHPLFVIGLKIRFDLAHFRRLAGTIAVPPDQPAWWPTSAEVEIAAWPTSSHPGVGPYSSCSIGWG